MAFRNFAKQNYININILRGKLMKKVCIPIAMLILMSMLVGCGNSTADNSNDTTTTTTAQTETQLETETIADTQTTESTEENSTSGDTVDLSAMVDEITSKVEWASLLEIEDDELISEFFTLDPNNPNYKQLLVMQCPMSAVIAEIILIQADDVDSAMDDLSVRQEKLINTDAYYPEHKEIAENSIINHVGDIVYFIAGENAEDSEKVLIDYINQLG
jgi:hypothetical protein